MVLDLIDSLRTARDRLVQEQAQRASQLEAIGRALAAFGGGSAAPAAGARRSQPRRAKRGSAIIAVLRTLQAKGPIKPTELARNAGVKATTASTLLDNLRKKSLAARSDSGWSLTASGRTELARRQKIGT
jgi:predicted transcriptional regulator